MRTRASQIFAQSEREKTNILMMITNFENQTKHRLKSVSNVSLLKIIKIGKEKIGDNLKFSPLSCNPSIILIQFSIFWIRFFGHERILDAHLDQSQNRQKSNLSLSYDKAIFYK